MGFADLFLPKCDEPTCDPGDWRESSGGDPQDESPQVTQMTETRGSREWRVPLEVLHRLPQGADWASEALVLAGLRWQIRVTRTEEFFSLYLHQTPDDATLQPDCRTYTSSVKLVVPMTNGKRPYILECRKQHEATAARSRVCGYHFFTTAQALTTPQGLAGGGPLLTICCQITVVSRFKKTKIVEFEADSLLGLEEDFGRLLESGEGADVIIRAEDRELRAHRAVLAARSRVFAAMLRHDMAEGRAGELSLPLSYAAAEALLRYLYTGRVIKLDALAPQLMQAADQYGLDALKQHCLTYLGSNMVVANAASVLALADVHDLTQLRQRAVLFITRNVEAVTNTEGWKELLQTRPALVTEVVRTLAK